MFICNCKNMQFKNPYPTVEHKLATVSDKGWDKVGNFTLRDHIDYMPQQGMQEQFLHCNSNLVFLCGESQMGKTFAMLLNVLKGIGKYNYTARFISVRLQDSKKGSSIFRDAVSVLGNFANCQYNASDYPTFNWAKWNNSLQLIHSNFNVSNPSEWADFKEYAKKNQASYICVDEATDIRDFKMFSYWFSRNRDDSGMTPQMVLSFNFEHTHFTTTMLKDAGYIGDDWWFKPEMSGVTRYFYIKGDTENEIIWGDTPEDVAERADIKLTPKEIAAGVTIRQVVKSFTAFSGESADNLKLLSATGGANIGNLHNTGATSRAILKHGYAGPVENDKITISRSLIHQLWENPIDNDDNFYATMDISSGKTQNDNAPMIIWRGLQIIAIDCFNGSPNEISSWIKTRLTKYNVPITNFAYDATGHGYWMQGLTNGVPITYNRRPIQEYDEYGNQATREDYFNCRSQLIGKTEVLLKSGYISCALPKDLELPYGKNGSLRRVIDVLFDEINIFAPTTKNKKIYYRSKEEYKTRFKSSPDLMDTICLRAVFELDARPKKQPQAVVSECTYDALYDSKSWSRNKGWWN